MGRDHEIAEIRSFLSTHLEKQSAGSLYISGAPGTGKTAAALHIIDDFKVGYSQCLISVNFGPGSPACGEAEFLMHAPQHQLSYFRRCCIVLGM